MPEIGDLVRVNPDYDFAVPADPHILEEHGYLWIRIEDDLSIIEDRDGLHDYRSLATGFVYRWYDYELIKEENNHG